MEFAVFGLTMAGIFGSIAWGSRCNNKAFWFHKLEFAQDDGTYISYKCINCNAIEVHLKDPESGD